MIFFRCLLGGTSAVTLFADIMAIIAYIEGDVSAFGAMVALSVIGGVSGALALALGWTNLCPIGIHRYGDHYLYKRPSSSVHQWRNDCVRCGAYKISDVSTKTWA